jgi:AcrR family transcriptional regulator
MGRPVNHARRAELLERAVGYVIEHGLDESSLRPLAAALDVTPTTLIHHFGTKDLLLEAILNRVRERLLEAIDEPYRSGADLTGLVRDAWAWSSDPAHLPLFRLFFDVYGRAVQKPGHYAQFEERVVADWLEVMTNTLQRDDPNAEGVQWRATLAVAAVRGLLLDLLITGDTDRVNEALDTIAVLLQVPQVPNRPSITSATTP